MRKPDWEGRCGKAWKCVPPTPEMLKQTPDWSASLVEWVLDIPGAHPAWHGYVMALIHLRDIPGVKPPVKRYPEAQHEIIIYALNAEFPLPDPDKHDKDVHYLTPVNLVHQFHGLTDEQAIELVNLLARGFVDGRINPDTDYRQHTIGVINKTVEHTAIGHPTARA